jgi:hypothetical protein
VSERRRSALRFVAHALAKLMSHASWMSAANDNDGDHASDGAALEVELRASLALPR